MKRYHYTASDLLKNPNNYMYTPYGGREFIKSYLNDRRFHINRFKILGVEQNLTETDIHICESSRCLLQENKNSRVFSHMSSINSFEDLKEVVTEDLLMSLLRSQFSGESNGAIKNAVDVLVQRFEVTKKLFDKYYSINLRKGEGENENIRLYWLFSVVLTLYYVKTKNTKYLSTVLKVNDLLCSLKDDRLIKIPKQGLELLLTKEVEIIVFLCDIVDGSSSCA